MSVGKLDLPRLDRRSIEEALVRESFNIPAGSDDRIVCVGGRAVVIAWRGSEESRRLEGRMQQPRCGDEQPWREVAEFSRFLEGVLKAGGR